MHHHDFLFNSVHLEYPERSALGTRGTPSEHIMRLRLHVGRYVFNFYLKVRASLSFFFSFFFFSFLFFFFFFFCFIFFFFSENDDGRPGNPLLLSATWGPGNPLPRVAVVVVLFLPLLFLSSSFSFSSYRTFKYTKKRCRTTCRRIREMCPLGVPRVPNKFHTGAG